MFDFFISHSTKDLNKIELIVKTLEKMGLKVWVAPRDIRKGHKFPEEIIFGIRKSEYFLLLFTDNSVISDAVKFETIIAFFEKKKIISVNQMSRKKGAFWNFYLQNALILDGLNENWNYVFSRLQKMFINEY